MAPKTYTRQQIIQIISAAAAKYGIPPQVLISVAQIESGLIPNKAGAGSYGLFQEQQGGELTSYSGGNISLADDPAHASEVAAQTIAAEQKQHPDWTWGQIAAGAQRPKYPDVYAQAVNSELGQLGTVPSNSPTEATLMSQRKPPKKTASQIAKEINQGANGPSLSSPGTQASGNTGLLNESKATLGTKLTGNNAGLLGNPSTIGEALAAMQKASPAQVKAMQLQLYEAGLLTKTPNWGVLDNDTVNAYGTLLKESVRQNTGVAEALGAQINSEPQNFLSQEATKLAGQAPGSTTIDQTSPDELAVELQKAWFSLYGSYPSQAQVNQFIKEAQQQQLSGQEQEASLPAAKRQQQLADDERARALTEQIGVAQAKGDTAAVTQLTGQLQSIISGSALTAVKTTFSATDAAQIFAQQHGGGLESPNSKAIKQMEGTVKTTAAQIGVALDPKLISSIAGQAVSQNWNSDQLKQAVAGHFTMPASPATLTGDAARVYQDMISDMHDYMVTVSPATIEKMLTQNIRTQAYAGTTGTAIVDAAQSQFQNYLLQQAKQMYPDLATQTNGFETIKPWDATSSIREKIGSALELDPNSIDLGSPQWSWTVENDPTTGAMPNMGQIVNKVMADPKYGYQYTTNAISKAYTVGLQLLKNMGAIG